MNFTVNDQFEILNPPEVLAALSFVIYWPLTNFCMKEDVESMRGFAFSGAQTGMEIPVATHG
jgi:hypothetical protein